LNCGTLSFMAPGLLAKGSAGGTRSVDTRTHGILLEARRRKLLVE
jgi:hypothetical protein